MNDTELNHVAGHLHALEEFIVGITNELITHDQLLKQRTVDYLNSRLITAHPADPDNPDHRVQLESYRRHMKRMIEGIRGR